MGRLTDDMSRLAGEIAAVRDSRKAFTSDLKNNSDARLTGFRDERATAAADDKAERDACISGIKSDVDALRSATIATMEANNLSHGKMAQETKAGRTAFVNELSSDVAAMTTGFSNERAETSKKLQSELTDYRADLAKSIADMEASVANTIVKFQQELSKSSDESHTHLDEFILELKSDVIELKQNATDLLNDYTATRELESKLAHEERDAFTADLAQQVSDLMRQFRTSRADMSDEMKADLLTFLTNLKGDVAGLKNATISMRQSFIDDLNGARQAWARLKIAAVVIPTVSVEPAPIKPVEPVVVVEKKNEPIVDAPTTDDLTALRGIGQSTNARLTEAGITSYAKLAACTVNQLHEIIGAKAAKFANMEEWISQAAELVKK